MHANIYIRKRPRKLQKICHKIGTKGTIRAMTKIRVVLLSLLVLLLVACSPNRLTIGAFLSLTGATSAYGISAANAFKLARDEVNKSGGINGRIVELEI